MSGLSLRFTLSQVMPADTTTQIPYVVKDGKGSLQFNSINFKTTTAVKPPVIFECPKKTSQPIYNPPPDNTPAPSFPPKQCAMCKSPEGGCHYVTLNVENCDTDCANKDCPPITPYVPPPANPDPNPNPI